MIWAGLGEGEGNDLGQNSLVWAALSQVLVAVLAN